MENIMGSLYSTDELPRYCFTIYSIWGEPNKKREKIPRGAVMKLHFFLNATRNTEPYPRYSLPSTPAVQLAVHAPYYLPSPFLTGIGVVAGKAYAMEIKQSEKHLLPSPYQTNCTDYMTAWRKRGGKGPINQMSVIQECKFNRSLLYFDCIPLSVDYPHQYKICKECSEVEDCDGDVANSSRDNCTLLAEYYNQPCDFISYDIELKSKVITVARKLDSPFLLQVEALREKLLEHDCRGINLWKNECSTIDVDVLFEQFEITNLTYNPKYESLELFSVVGGYMGMWLGVSLVAVYDFFASLVSFVHRAIVNKRKQRSHVFSRKQLALQKRQNYGRSDGRDKKMTIDSMNELRTGYDAYTRRSRLYNN